VGIATRTGGDGQLLCLCEGPTACNYWNYLCEDAGAASDAGPVSDTGFADVEPMDASALDALITNDTSGG
jgi:hypothetical protein